MNIQKPKDDFPALTGLRFLAASMVYLFHYSKEIFPYDYLTFEYFFLRQFNVGVNLFFVLSGFLITHRYYDYIASGQPLRSYFIKRIARIFPIYWAVLLMHFVFVSLQKHQWPEVKIVLLNATLLHGFSGRYFFSGLTQSWSLTVEETFYLFAPVCFALIRFRRFFIWQFLVLFAIGFLLVRLHPFLPDGFWGDFVYFSSGTFLGRCFEFFVGIFLALVIKKRHDNRKGMAYTLGGSLAFIVLLVALGAFAEQHQLERVHVSWTGVLLFNFLLPASAGFAYYGLLTEKTVLRSFFSSRPLLLLGKSSYAFYLLHVGVAAHVFYFHVSTNLVLLYLFLQVLSVGVYKVFEKPVYFLLLKKLLPKERSNDPAAHREHTLSGND